MHFWKMNGAGNDFILLNQWEETIPESAYPALARTLCERHLSIGADGLMVVRKPLEDGDYRMVFYNSDGSAGEMCGNGARCICRYGCETGLAGETQRVETPAGIVTGRRLDPVNYRIRLNDPSLIDLHRAAEAEGIWFDCAYIELGNPGLPHAVVAMPGLREANEQHLLALGRALRWHPVFPKGANVNFYEQFGPDRIYLRTYERGVEDFTYACGTGTGSTALALMLLGLTGNSVVVETRGGTMYAAVDCKGGSVENLWLTGPTNVVAKGEITDENMEVIIRRKEI